MNWSDLFAARLIQQIHLHQCLKARQLVEQFPHPANLLEIRPAELKHWLPQEDSQRLWYDASLRRSIEQELEWYNRHRVQVVFLHDPNYPKRLKECPDAPILLYHLGHSPLEGKRMLAIVGTRSATAYGKQFVRDLIHSASQLDPAPIIVSGLAYGIDIEAHRCCLEHQVQTHAVLANGLDHIYPAAHRNTARTLLQHGRLWSEFPKGTPSLPFHFLQRNRIIAGMCDATLLCESSHRGGGMATARHAAAYNREVFALPGRIHDPHSAGCNELISNQTASLVISPEQLWECLGWNTLKKNQTNPKELSIFECSSELSQTIFRLIGEHACLTPDQLMDLCPQAGLQDLSIALTALELEGLIRQQAGGYTKA